MQFQSLAFTFTFRVKVKAVVCRKEGALNRVFPSCVVVVYLNAFSLHFHIRVAICMYDAKVIHAHAHTIGGGVDLHTRLIATTHTHTNHADEIL